MTTNSFTNEPNSSNNQTTLKNPNCEPVSRFKVTEVLEECALANACEQNSYGLPDDMCIGLMVCIPIEPDKLYYDDQFITPETGKCFTYVGTVKYRFGINTKTIPVVGMTNAHIKSKD